MPTRAVPVYEDDVSELSAGTSNARPIGIIGYEELDSNTGGTTTTENAVQCVDVPVEDGRLISIRANGTIRATGPSGLQVLLIEDSTTILRRNFFVSESSQDAAFSVEALSHSPSAGDHTYTLAYGISGGSGETANVIADVDEICYLIVEDKGEDFV